MGRGRPFIVVIVVDFVLRSSRDQEQANYLKLSERRKTSQRREIGLGSKLMRRSVEPVQTLAILDAGRAPPAGQLEMKDSGWISGVEVRMRSSTELGSGKGE